MKKLLRKLLNRTMLVILILVIELAVVITAIIVAHSIDIEAHPELIWVRTVDDLIILILIVFQIIILFRVMYRQMDAEFKIPWILVLLLLPLVGAILYLIFGRTNLKGKDSRLLASSDGIGAKYFLDKPDRKKYGDYHKTFDCLDFSSILHSHDHNRVTYYKNGEAFFPAMIEELEKAEEFIFMEFFIIGDGQMWQKVRKILIDKAQKGLDVRVIFDDLGSVGVLPGDEVKNLRENGVKIYKYNKFRPIVSGIYNNRDHRKICIVDHRCGFTGGINLADEYANIDSPFGYWKDTMVKIEGSGISNLIQLFLTNFDLCAKKTSDHSKFLDYKYKEYNDEGIIFPFGHGPAPYYKERVGEQTLINIIESAQKTLLISSPYFIPSESLFYAIRRAALSGVEVKLFLPGIPDKKVVYHLAQTFFDSLLVAGVHIFTYRPGFNHMKTLIADGKLAFVGTINCDYRSLVHHFECGTVLLNTPCCKDIEADFAEMEIASEEVSQSFRMPKIRVFLCMLLRPFISLM